MPDTNFNWSQPVSAAMQGGFGIIGNLINYGLQKRLTQQQNEFNLQMWNMQNEYNSPAAQMKRLEEAGLNPALMYGQGSTGNAAHAPQMVTPEAPQIDKHMAQLAEAFNIEGFKTAQAQRKEAQAKAVLADIAAAEAKDERQAREDVGILYQFNPETGRFDWYNPDVSVITEPSREMKARKDRTGAYSTRSWYFMKELENNFRNTFLLYPRSLLMENTRNLNNSRISLLAPQIGMRRYEERMIPYGYWIDKGAKAFNALPLPKLNVKFNQ